MSTVKADRFQESTPGAGVTVAGLKFPAGDSPLDAAIPRGRRVTTTLVDYLDRNKTTNSKDYLVADGVANDYAKFTDMQVDAGAGGELMLAAGTILVDAGGTAGAPVTVTVPQHIKPRRGILLRPALGTIINCTGPVDEVMFQWIDESLGGAVTFVGNRSIPWFIPQWFGVKGDDVNADYLPLYYLLNSIPDWANIWFGAHMKMQLDYGVFSAGRTGLTLWTEGWPLELYGGNDGTMFRWRGPAGGIMMGFYNCSYISVRGFMWDGGPLGGGASCGLDFDEFTLTFTNASPNFSVDIQNAGPSGVGLGPAILTSLPVGFPVQIGNIGPGGTTLRATLNAPTDAKHGVLSVNSSLTASNIVAGFGPGYPQLVLKITTSCFIARNRFVGAPRNRVWSCIRISKTSLTNCECFLIRENFTCGNGNTSPGIVVPYLGATVRGIWGGSPNTFVSPGGGMAAGSNDLMGFTSDIFDSSIEGLPILVARAGVAWVAGSLPPGGPNNAPANITGFVHFVDARHIQIRDAGGAAVNAASAVPTTGFPLGFQIDRAMGIGIEVGYSQEPHHQVLENNMAFSLEYGCWIGGGSHHDWMGQYTDNEVNKYLGNRQANPSTAYGINSENSRMHLFIQPTARYAERGSRCAMLYTAPGSGYITVFGASSAIAFEDCQFENQLGPAQAVFDLHAAAGQVIQSTRCDYLLMSPVTLDDSLKMLGWKTLPPSVYIESKYDSYPGSVAEATFTADAFQTSLKRHYGPVAFTAIPETAPVAGDFLAMLNEYTAYLADATDHARQLAWMVMGQDRTLRTFKALQMHQKKSNLGPPPDLAAGALQTLGDISVPGAVAGDIVIVGLSQALAGSQVYGRCFAADSVRLYQYNNTGGALSFQNNPDYYITVIHFDTF